MCACPTRHSPRSRFVAIFVDDLDATTLACNLRLLPNMSLFAGAFNSSLNFERGPKPEPPARVSLCVSRAREHAHTRAALTHLHALLSHLRTFFSFRIHWHTLLTRTWSAHTSCPLRGGPKLDARTNVWRDDDAMREFMAVRWGAN